MQQLCNALHAGVAAAATKAAAGAVAAASWFTTPGRSNRYLRPSPARPCLGSSPGGVCTSSAEVTLPTFASDRRG